MILNPNCSYFYSYESCTYLKVCLRLQSLVPWFFFYFKSSQPVETYLTQHIRPCSLLPLPFCASSPQDHLVCLIWRFSLCLPISSLKYTTFHWKALSSKEVLSFCSQFSPSDSNFEERVVTQPFLEFWGPASGLAGFVLSQPHMKTMVVPKCIVLLKIQSSLNCSSKN